MNSRSQPVIRPEDIVIPVMGITGSGKSSFIQLCTSEKVDIGHGLLSCTAECMMYSLQRHGRTIRLIDTPGFDDSTRDDLDILTEIAYWLSQAYRRLHLAGIIYLHPINAPKLGGMARRNLNMFKLLCGKNCLRSVVLATNHWDKVDHQEGLKRQKELVATDAFWGDMVAAGSRVVVHDNSATSAFRIIDRIIEAGDNMVLDIQRELVDEHRVLEDTSAGQEQLKKFLAEKAKAEARLKRKEAELEEALRNRQQQDAQRILEEQKSYSQQLQDKQEKLSAMRLDMDALRKEKEAQWERECEDLARQRKEIEETAKRVQQEVEAVTRAREEDRKKTSDLEAGLERLSKMSSSDSLSHGEVEQVNRMSEIARNREELDFVRREMVRKDAEISQYRAAHEAMIWQQRQLQEAEMLKYTKSSARWGTAGALAGLGSLALAMQCSVM